MLIVDTRRSATPEHGESRGRSGGEPTYGQVMTPAHRRGDCSRYTWAASEQNLNRSRSGEATTDPYDGPDNGVNQHNRR